MAQPKEENRLKLLDLCERLCHPLCVGLRLRSRPGFPISRKSQKGKMRSTFLTSEMTTLSTCVLGILQFQERELPLTE